MKCPFCGYEDSKVTDSRLALELNAIRRRRECLKCLKRFTTFETVELAIQVQKRDGRFEEFREDKLINGLEAACRHTRISREGVKAIVAQVKAELMERQVQVVTTKELGDMVMRQLQALDSIAYIRFACVYQRFKDLKELIDAIQSIQSKDGHVTDEISS